MTFFAKSGTDEKVKVSSNDSTSGFLNGKLVAGTGITLTENNNGGDETLTIESTGGGGDEEIDGGFANSVYLVSQAIDGGNATSF